MTGCPKSWQNFVKYLRQTNIPTTLGSNGYTTKTLNKHLRPFNAIYYDVEDGDELSHIIFEDESDFLIFELKFEYN